ncbi:hypothetical protein F5B19DRAFT_498103 [Rostrohypoxylon terebratum]|nr:hypothetical protein F5B19DRAFT_498103 [Rostrohypoxylon terebratum]
MATSLIPTQTMSLTAPTGSASRQVYNIPELLENILKYCDNSDVLVVMQRVSKHFYHAINKSPSIQFKLGFQSDPLESKRVMNRFLGGRVASLLLHSLSWNRVVFIHWARAYSGLSSVRLPPSISQPFKSGWLTQTASWRRMQASHTPITKVYWQVTRAGDLDIPTGLYSSVLQIEFPNGLTMGDYLGLRIQTKGTHRVIWPSKTRAYHLGMIPPPANLVDAMRIHDFYTASHNDALLIAQTIPARRPPPNFGSLAERGMWWSFWDPIDFTEDHCIITKLEDINLTMNLDTGVVSWTYIEPCTNSASAKQWFINNLFD